MDLEVNQAPEPLRNLPPASPDPILLLPVHVSPLELQASDSWGPFM